MREEHNHGTVSNTDEVFSTFIGCKVKGLLHETNTYGGDTVILVFECGWGLAFNDNGSHWTEPPRRVEEILRKARKKLNITKKELEQILELAGEKANS